jgi:hypothetical protein
MAHFWIFQVKLKKTNPTPSPSNFCSMQWVFTPWVPTPQSVGQQWSNLVWRNMFPQNCKQNLHWPLTIVFTAHHKEHVVYIQGSYYLTQHHIPEDGILQVLIFVDQFTVLCFSDQCTASCDVGMNFADESICLLANYIQNEVVTIHSS